MLDIRHMHFRQEIEEDCFLDRTHVRCVCYSWVWNMVDNSDQVTTGVVFGPHETDCEF